MTRILLVAPVGSDMHLGLEQAVAARAVGPATEVIARHLEGVPDSVYVPPEEVFLPPLVEAVERGAAEGFDAIGISCCSDPGLAICRSAVDVPVGAPFEAVSRRLPEVGSLGILYVAVPPIAGESELRGEEWIPALLATYGCASSVGPVLPVPVARPQVDFRADDATPEAVGEALVIAMREAMNTVGIERAREAAARGARAVLPTCTYWAGVLDEVREAIDDVLVLDPIEELARDLEARAG
jgi:Asp/Glu/Hydantoin racemase